MMHTHINGIRCTVHCRYYAGSEPRSLYDEPDMPEFEILAVYNDAGDEDTELRYSIDENTQERIYDEWLEFIR